MECDGIASVRGLIKMKTFVMRSVKKIVGIRFATNENKKDVLRLWDIPKHAPTHVLHACVHPHTADSATDCLTGNGR